MLVYIYTALNDSAAAVILIVNKSATYFLKVFFLWLKRKKRNF